MFWIKNRIISPTFWPFSCRFSIRRQSRLLTLQHFASDFAAAFFVCVSVHQLAVFSDIIKLSQCIATMTPPVEIFYFLLDLIFLSIEFRTPIPCHLNCRFHFFRVKMLHFSIFCFGHSSCSFRFMFFQLWIHFEHFKHVCLHLCTRNRKMLIANHVNMIASMKMHVYFHYFFNISQNGIHCKMVIQLLYSLVCNETMFPCE